MTVPARDDAVSDADLIRGWRERGDETCASELVRRHGGALARFLKGAGAWDEHLEDVVQETFFRAFRRIESFRGGAAFRTWLLAIGSNVLRDSWRKRKRRPVVSIEDREIVDEGSTADGDASAREWADRLAEAVKMLPPMQRDVFLLRAQQGSAYAEIAEALATSVGAARVHYHHAVRRLKAVLKGDD